MSGKAPLPHPAFASFDQVVPLSGFSGAAIALLRDAQGSQFVRKASGSVAGNEALRLQSARQAWLRDYIGEIARVPEILREDTIDGLYYFDMAFVPSSNANVYLSRASFSQVKLFARRVEDLMRRFSSMPDPTAVAPSYQALLDKVAEIDRKTTGRFAHLLEPLSDSFSRLQARVPPPQATIMHGDLTFENILVDSGGDLWLIDSIKPPIESYWLDWSKLFQECEGRWYRHRGILHSAGVIEWLRKEWTKTACAMSPHYASHHYPLLALTFARILPYAKTAEDTEFVVKRVARFGRAALHSNRETP